MPKKGYKQTSEHKKKISESLKGRIFTNEWRQKLSENHRDVSGKNNPMFGKDFSDKNNPNYKHGLSYTRAYDNQISSKRRAMKLNQTPILTENEKSKVEMYYKVSQYLGEDWEIDHIIPLSKGGPHHPDNLQVVTKEYNLQKSNKLNFRAPTALEYWRI